MNDNDIEILVNLYKEYYGCPPAAVVKLEASGGDRKYYRMTSETGVCIGTVGDNEAECRSFVALSGIFSEAGVDVPEVYMTAPDNLHYIQQDLGDVSLYSLIGRPEWREMAEMTIMSLARMHSIPSARWENSVVYKPFSRRQVMWDLNYFKYEYLKPCRIPMDEDRLEDDLERFADKVTNQSGPRNFMMRDCQSRNVMIREDKPYLIDFQSGRKGAVTYDLVSFLWQAKARIDPAVRAELCELYAYEMEKHGYTASSILDAVPLLALFRTMQVLGAYGFRGLVQKRAHFIESIQPALDNLSDLIRTGALEDCPELLRVCEYAASHSPIPAPHRGLRIKVFSFSYKRGYPEDLSGNGGGFMFDCRGMHNPGRYEEYKSLTGLDKPVRDFLEQRGEVQRFVKNAIDMVSPSVECYLRRGFSDLQIGFGCTGGRHRSVYCAEAVGRALADRYPEADVWIIHREQDIKKRSKTNPKAK